MEPYDCPSLQPGEFCVAVQGRGIQKEPSGLLELLRQRSELKEAKAVGMGLDMQEVKYQRGGSTTERELCRAATAPLKSLVEY